MLIHAWLFNSPSSIALYSSMKSSTSSMKEKLKDSQQQILTKTPKKGYSESITCPVSAAPHRCEKINPNLTVSHCLTRKLEFAVKHTTEWNHFQIFIHSLYSCLPAFLFVHFQCCEELQGCCRASLHTKATKKPEVLHQSRLFPESDKEEYTVAACFCSHLSRWQQPVIWCALSIHSDWDTSRSMVTVFCETWLLSFSVGVSASQESSMASSLSASWWLWPYSGVMPPISATEVKPAVKKMKCGPDSIPAGVWELPGCHNALILTSQFNWIISHDEVLRFGWPALQCPFRRAKVMSWNAQVISWFGESLQLDPERANLCSSGTQRSRRPCPVQLLYLTISTVPRVDLAAFYHQCLGPPRIIPFAIVFHPLHGQINGQSPVVDCRL